MSGLDPLAAIAAQFATQAQLVAGDTALDLGVAPEILQAQLNVGDLLSAVVLPPQNGVDRISLFGQTVAAQLPPGIDPGESLVLQVTGFQGQQIYVRNLGPADPQHPLPTVTVDLTQPAPAQSQPQTQSQTQSQTTPAQAPPAAQTSPGTQTQTPQTAAPARGFVAPPREIFVQASVRPSANAAELSPEVQLRNAVARSIAAPSVPRTPSAAPQMPSPAPRMPATAPAPAATPQSSLLARLRVPISSSTLVAARLMDDAAHHVTTSYQRLDQALSKLSAQDPRAGSLRSLLSFVGKMDLRNTRALPEQIAAFVSHVVDGAENKVAQIVRALTAVAQHAEELASQSPETETQTLSADDAQPQSFAPAAPLEGHAAPPATLAQTNAASAVPAAAARAAERTVALEHDVKTAIMALVQNPPRGMTPAATQALSSALGATTALQLNVLSSQSSDPSTIAIPLPAYFYDGGKPAHLTISRDAPGGGKAMDGDNFHVAFVLDTKTMGTIAIDVQTVGRAVSVNVKTERSSALSRFRDSFADLRGRLEQLRYRVASMGADVAPAVAPAPSAPSPQPPSAKSNLDMRA